MSAIAGIINFDNKEIPSNDISTIEKVSSIFCTDRTDKFFEKNIFFLCSHQYFSAEAINDVSPIIDKKNNIIFNADIFLYNRATLINLLKDKTGLSYENIYQKGDAELAYLIYLNYGISFVNILEGAYSIVIFDKAQKNIYLITDHIAGRHITYSIMDHRLFYSSTLHVISALYGSKLELDEEWISAAYMDFSPDTEKLYGRSVYKNIFRVEPGHYIKISLSTKNNNNIISENIEYWNPLKSVRPLNLSSDEEYGNLFRKTFSKSVSQMLRAREKNGVFLSGGLDSSAVASVAANELSKSGSKLYSYTQIPCAEYKCSDSWFLIEDETKDVLKNQKKYPNIECRFIPVKDLTVFSEEEKYLLRFAQPVKPILNSPYLYAMDEEIKKYLV